MVTKWQVESRDCDLLESNLPKCDLPPGNAHASNLAMSKGNQSVSLKENCACGAVHVEVQGAILSMLLCCCRDCQVASGAGHTALAMFGKDSVRISGEVRQHDVIANSGGQVGRQFCATCGTHVLGLPGSFPELRILPVGIFGQSDWFTPRAVIFHRSHQKWDQLPDNVPVYETYREN